MQPDDNQKDTWQQPTPKPAGSPYVPPQGGQTEDASSTPTPVAAPSVVEEPPEPTSPPSASTPSSPTTQNYQEEADPASDIDETAVRWQATEYIHREKNSLWYVIFAVVVVVLVALAIFLMHAWTFALLIPVMAAALIVYTRRPPRVLNYILSRQGLHVNDKLYPFSEFKGFSVIHGDDEYSIMLVPVKRFKPGVSVYFPEESGEAIVDMLAARMPMQETHLDFMDQIIRKLRI